MAKIAVNEDYAASAADVWKKLAITEIIEGSHGDYPNGAKYEN